MALRALSLISATFLFLVLAIFVVSSFGSHDIEPEDKRSHVRNRQRRNQEESTIGVEHDERDMTDDTQTTTSDTTTDKMATPGLTSEQYLHRIHAKESQKLRIQRKILESISPAGRVMKNSEPSWGNIIVYQEEVEMLNGSKTLKKLSGYKERRVTYNPSCETPPRTNQVWNTMKRFNLYFPIEPVSIPDTKSKMVAAKLRLFKEGPKDCNCHNEEGISDEDEVDEDTDEEIEVANQKDKDETQSREIRRSLRSKRRLRKYNRSKVTRSAQKSRRKVDKNHKKSNVKRQERTSDDETDTLRITVYWYRKPIKRKSKTKKQMAASMVVDRRKTGWIELDMQIPVKRWLKHPDRNFGVEIRVEDAESNPIDPREVFSGSSCGTNQEDIYANLNLQDLLDGKINITEPLLEVILEDTPLSVSRPKRHVSQPCVRNKIYISFKELGLNRILAPTGIEAGYCEGHCLQTIWNDGNSTNEQLNAPEDKYRGEQKGCCGPTKTANFPFLHVEPNGRITFNVIPDFIVTECGCRD